MQDPADGQPMLDTAKWMLNQGDADDGLHNPVSGWLWWAWNANSGSALVCFPNLIAALRSGPPLAGGMGSPDNELLHLLACASSPC